MVKADSDKYKNMLKEVRELCEKLNDIIDDDIVIRILTKCQESVIVIGESLEKIERANEKEVLKKLQTVNKLEQLCELLYQYSQKMERNIRKEIIRIIDNIICDIDTIPRTYRVTFLPYKAAMWDSLESIWREFAGNALHNSCYRNKERWRETPEADARLHPYRPSVSHHTYGLW